LGPSRAPAAVMPVIVIKERRAIGGFL
jgi:hypothetical protein